MCSVLFFLTSPHMCYICYCFSSFSLLRGQSQGQSFAKAKSKGKAKGKAEAQCQGVLHVSSYRSSPLALHVFGKAQILRTHVSVIRSASMQSFFSAMFLFPCVVNFRFRILTRRPTQSRQAQSPIKESDLLSNFGQFAKFCGKKWTAAFYH